MEKDRIKHILRENLLTVMTEDSQESESTISAEYAEIRNGLSGLGAPSQADIMQMAGLGKKGDKTAESLFGKKLHRDKNDEGGVYQFDEKERASVVAALRTAKK